MKPYLDCPRCPHCGLSVSVPRRAADWNHRAKPQDRIVCTACGNGWVGSEDDVAQAERAHLAWEEKERRETALEARQ